MNNDSARGAMLGSAIGDSIGAHVEFLARGTFQLVTDMRGGGTWNLPVGHWTDDTAMMLCLAESLIRKKTHDPIDQLETYTKWIREGHNSSTGKAIGIGGTVLNALQTYNATGKNIVPTDEYSSGNGCIMRIAPAVILFHNMSNGIELCVKTAKVTHGSNACEEASRFFSWLLMRALDHERDILDTSSYPFKIKECLNHIISKEYVNKTPDRMNSYLFGSIEHTEYELKSGGYVVDTIEAAMWAFYNSNTFEEGMLKAVNLGFDSDTVGAVYGQLAGAYYGESGIPQKWIVPLAKKDLISYCADKLVKLHDENVN